MKPSENSNWQIDIDRLVDGELGADAERELLAKLDHVADGWRMCALAFVENRVLQREFAGLQNVEATKQDRNTELSVSVASKPISRTSSRSTQWLSIAVGVAIAFMLGMFVPQFSSYFSKPSSPVAGGKEKLSSDPLPIAKNSNNQQQPNAKAVNENIAGQPDAEPLLSPMQKGIELQMVDRKGEYPTQSVKLPLTQLNKFDASVAEALQKWTDEQPIPKELVQEAAFNGQQIQKESMLMPMTMNDGTNVIVPVQRLRFQPQEVVWH